MNTFFNPDRNRWPELQKRPVIDFSDLYSKVNHILSEIKSEGDLALRKFTSEFDKIKLDSFKVSEKDIFEAGSNISEKLKIAIELAYNNIHKFHSFQKQAFTKIETANGVYCWQKAVAIEKVGLYIPGGSAPLFSTVLMLAIPAKIAGCKTIILCSPPNKEGKIHPAILYAAKISGVTEIFKLGGVQAIGAMTYGTETVPKVYKIFGPGNQYVTAAKQLVGMNDVAIDMPAGPSEMMIVADEMCNPAFVAADLLSQAEHGNDSQVILLSDSINVISQIEVEVRNQVERLPRKAIAEEALKNSRIIVLPELADRIDFINEYAPEHLILSCRNFSEIAEKIINAGSVFLGNYTPESAGDYASGTNHTLPTNGWAKAYSGLNLDSFLKKITFQEITQEGIGIIGPYIEEMAEKEELEGHKNAVTLRLKS